jgi:hypothetical protein
MSVTTLKLHGREYVLVPRKRYDELASAEEDRLSAAGARRALKEFRAGKLKTIPHQQAKRLLGL